MTQLTFDEVLRIEEDCATMTKEDIAAKYLLQLKEEREGAGKLLDALQRFKDSCPDGSWFEKTATKAITEYKNNNQ